MRAADGDNDSRRVGLRRNPQGQPGLFLLDKGAAARGGVVKLLFSWLINDTECGFPFAWKNRIRPAETACDLLRDAT